MPGKLYRQIPVQLSIELKLLDGAAAVVTTDNRIASICVQPEQRWRTDGQKEEAYVVVRVKYLSKFNI